MFFKVIGRLTASFLHGLGKGFYKVFSWVGKHPVGFLSTVIIVVGGIVAIWGFNLFGIADGTFMSSNQTVVKPMERTAEPDGKSVEFLNALKDANATKLYDTLGDDYKKTLAERGVSSAGAMQTILTAQIEQATSKKNSKLNYQFSYLGGIKYSDGSIQNAFGGEISGASARNNLEYVFKLKSGKILQVETTDPLVIAILGANKTAGKEDAQVGAISNNRSSTTESFMVGLTTFDADKIWETFSEAYKLELKSRNVTRESMATAFTKLAAQLKEQGQKVGYEGFVYNNSINFPNGITSHNYISIFSVNDKPNEFSYLLVVDKDNKIIKIGYGGPSDPLLESLLRRGQQGQE